MQFSISGKLKSFISFLTQSTFWVYTVIAILFKTIIFLGFIVNDNHFEISFSKGFDSVASYLVYISFIVIFASFAYFLKNRGHFLYLYGLNMVISILLIIDLWYYRGFGNLISVHAITQTGNLDNLGDTIISLISRLDLVFLVDLVAIFVYTLVFKKKPVKVDRNILAFVIIFIISVGFIGGYHYKVDILENGQKEILFRVCWYPNQTISNLSPVGYHVYDAYSYWKDSQIVDLTSEERSEIKEWFKGNFEELPDNQYKDMLKGKNLIFLQVESLENFVIGQKISSTEITPNLNKIAKNSIYFPNIHEQVYNGTTSDCELMSNTSVHPIRRGSTFFRYPANTYNSMPKLLEKLGYNTLAMHPDDGAYWNWMDALSNIGFNKCIDSKALDSSETVGLGISDVSFLSQVGNTIKAQKKPFYTFAITVTNHGPFNLPENLRELKLEGNIEKTKLGGYLQGAHYTDKAIGELIDSLDSDGILEDTVMVIYGDHGGIHKYYNDELKEIEPKEEWWTNPKYTIPLMIYGKNIKPEIVSTIGGQIDILPTVAYLMGISEDEYKNSAMGRNLLKTNRNFTVSADGQIIGEPQSSKDGDHAVKGIEIAQKILTGDYFKTN